MFTTSPLKRLRQSSWMEAIPDTINVPALSDRPNRAVPIERATVDDIEFALIQMKSETLNKINDALIRLDQDNYGNCFECGEEIAEKRLRALPFAVRCKDCEEARENAEQRERQMAARRGASSLFFDM